MRSSTPPPAPSWYGGRGQLPGSLPGRARHLLLLHVQQGEDEEAAGGAVGPNRAALDQQGQVIVERLQDSSGVVGPAWPERSRWPATSS